MAELTHNNDRPATKRKHADQPPSSGAPAVSVKVRAEVMEYLQAFVIAVVLAAFIITFIAQSFVVQGSSMEPTLHNGERLLVNKFIYRFREPARGEIVVFRYPFDPRRKFIKRVIGVPGDRMEIRDGSVFLNGSKLDEPYTLDLTYGTYGPEVVPEGRVFVLGDNRNNSEDSRFADVGFVPLSNVVGHAFLIYWPLNRIGLVHRAAIQPGAASRPGAGATTQPGG
ncbi:MAG: signal peptidase I [Firmicutes bacterium]|nr:signal peptidase I [Bacillota bacterium]